MITFVMLNHISLNLKFIHPRMQQTDQPHFALHVRIIAFIFSACMLCSTVMAHSLDFRCLDTSTGLADSHVSTIIKDRNGFLWIGTAAGLSRYDGFRFKNYILQVRVLSVTVQWERK